MKTAYGIFVFLIVLVVSIIIIITILDTGKPSEITQSTSDFYDIPVNVYEIWDSKGIVIHGNVDKQDKESVVKIQIIDKQGSIIDSGEVIPDNTGRFALFVSKFIPEGFELKSVWKENESYDVFATYKYPIPSSNNFINNILFEKYTVPLTSELLSNLTHQEVIDIIEKWNSIGGNSPFTVMSIIGIDEKYNVGQPMPFFIHKSGYGIPCYDQGVVVFDKNTKDNVGQNFYFPSCYLEEQPLVPFDYLIPYNQDGFPKLKPITKPGDYVMVTASSDISAKVKQEFTVTDSDFIYDYKIKYALQHGSSNNTKTMEIDLNLGNIIIYNTDTTIKQTSLDSDTLNRIKLIIDENNLATNPLNSVGYGDFCSTCNFGHIKLLIGNTTVNQILWDDKSTNLISSSFRSFDDKLSTYFSLINCVSSKNGFEDSWIDNSNSSSKKYTESKLSCNELIKPHTVKSNQSFGSLDYDFLVNDKPRKNIPVGAGNIGGEHVHASLSVIIFGDKFNFSTDQYQVKSPYIHFEGRDGNTIHRHASGVNLGYLFDSVGIGLDDNCYTFTNGREFCTNNDNDYSLKFYINGEQVDSVTDYILLQNDRILISYGFETADKIQEQITELELQEINSFR